MNMLVAIESPISVVAVAVESRKSQASAPTAASIDNLSMLPGKLRSGWRVKSPVMVSCVLITARDWPGSRRANASALALTTRSQPSSRSAPPAPSRTACSDSGEAPMRTWLTTAPPFCAMPSWSSTLTPLSSMCAAVPMMAPMVTTPVPPMPVMSTPYCLSATEGRTGAGMGSVSVAFPLPGPSEGGEAVCVAVPHPYPPPSDGGGLGRGKAAAVALPFLRLPPSTVTKLGQKPLRQEKSLLHDDWSIVRLLPNSVSTGTTLRQFDWVEQSPQPSQTAWLMNTRRAGSG